MSTLPAAPGDVLAVYGGGIGGTLVRWGQWLARKPAPAGHVVIITHQDVKGRWMGIQGAPGGVSLVDCTPFLNDSRARSNHGQPRADDHGQLTAFLAGTAKSIGVQYDWVGIAGDAAAALHAPDLSALIDQFWRWPSNENLVPGHVVCSTLAAMLYDEPAVSWAHPDLGHERMCLPSDWFNWNTKQLWLT